MSGGCDEEEVGAALAVLVPRLLMLDEVGGREADGAPLPNGLLSLLLLLPPLLLLLLLPPPPPPPPPPLLLLLLLLVLLLRRR